MAAEYLEIHIAPGETKTIWEGFGLSGTVNVAFASESPTAVMETWWIVLPWGKTSGTTQLGSTAILHVPWWGVGAKLRVRVSHRTVVHLSENAQPPSFSFSW